MIKPANNAASSIRKPGETGRIAPQSAARSCVPRILHGAPFGDTETAVAPAQVLAIMKSALRGPRLTERQENPARIEAFSDGVFAVAITLLVIDIHVPTFPHEPSNAEMWSALGGIGSKLLLVAVSFVMIGFFWIGHHLIFWSIERSNRILMWLNLLFLFPIVCLPAATALVGEYPKNGTAATVYVAIVMSTALLLDLVWWYSSSNGLVSSSMTPASVLAQHRRLIVVTLIMLVAGCVAPFLPQFAIGAMLAAILYIIVTTGSRMLVD